VRSETVLALGNQALALLGAQPVLSIEEGTDLAATLLAVAPGTLRQCLGAHPWRCTLAQIRLARLAEPPPQRWRHAFALPAELIALRRLTASALPGAAPLKCFAMVGETVQADADEVWAEVQIEPPLPRWPPHLLAFARAALAADLALSVTASNSDAELWQQRAWGRPAELGQGGLFGIARRIEAQQSPIEPLDDWPLVGARLGG
jgi:hypothetical protein